MNSPGGGMNGPVAGIRASEARVSHRVGGKRTPVGTATGLKSLATREDPDGLQPMAAGLPFPVPRADAESFTEIAPG